MSLLLLNVIPKTEPKHNLLSHYFTCICSILFFGSDEYLRGLDWGEE